MAIDLFECAWPVPTAYGIFEDTAWLMTSLGMCGENSPEILGGIAETQVISCVFLVFGMWNPFFEPCNVFGPSCNKWTGQEQFFFVSGYMKCELEIAEVIKHCFTFMAEMIIV